MQFYNYYFTKINNLKTYQKIDPAHFIESPKSKQNSKAIVDGSLYLVSRLVKNFNLNHNCNDYDFIDVGCGNGLPMIFVKKKFNFKTVSGFDHLNEVVERCKDNIKRSRLKDINVFNYDAKEFKLSNKSNFVYMYNPFDSEILYNFMKNNIDNLRKNKSVIAYINQIDDELKIFREFLPKEINVDKYFKIYLIFF
tara:strand:- start:33 stop:617 length:585 start_codon:yes stop_codon:yes gene_type:complete